MSITWGDIKRKVRYKGNYERDEEAENEYMYLDAANEALSHLQHDCPKEGKYVIPLFRVPDLLHGNGRMIPYNGTPITFSAENAQCWRGNIIGTCIVDVVIETNDGSSIVTVSGDADANGILNANDALTVLRYALGLSNDINLENADVDNSGTVDTNDALQLLRIALGLRPLGNGSAVNSTQILSGQQAHILNTPINTDYTVTITFSPYNNQSFVLADFAMFGSLDSNGEVPQTGEYYRYDLSSLISDFLELCPQERQPMRLYIAPYGYVPAVDYHVEREKELYINSANEGTYELYYHKRLANTLITASTADTDVVDLDDVQIELLVDYMAYEVEKYNDIQIAYTFLNDYNSQLASYMNRPRVNDVPVCINTKGWW